MTVGASLLRVGVVGVGNMGGDHAERLAHRTAGATLAAVADPDADRAAALGGSLGVPSYGDALQLIRSDEVDAVLLASPGFAHEEQLLECIRLGKPTLCEKPLTMDSASSLRVVRAELEGGRPLVSVGFMRRFDPEYRQVSDWARAGELGRLLMLHNVHRNHAVPNADFRSEMIVRDSLVHEVDVARFLFDEEIETIHVMCPRPTSRAAAGVQDPQLAVFRMAGGALVDTEVFCNSHAGYQVRAEAVFEQGSVTIGRAESGVLSVLGQGEKSFWGGPVMGDYRSRFARAYDLEVQAWADAARASHAGHGDRVVGATAWDGYAATAVCTAGMESLVTGQPVEVVLEAP